MMSRSVRVKDGFANYDRWKLASPEDEEDRRIQERLRLERDMEMADEWLDRRRDDKANGR